MIPARPPTPKTLKEYLLGWALFIGVGVLVHIFQDKPNKGDKKK